MTFLEIKRGVYRRCKMADTPSTTDATRIGAFINTAYRRVLSTPGLGSRLRFTTQTFATVSGVAQYGVPQMITDVKRIYDTANQREIYPQSVDWLRRADPGLSATSDTSMFWIPIQGWGATQRALTSTGVPLWAVSSSASDTAVRLYVETTRLGGVRGGLAVSTGTLLTGTTAVQIGSLSDHTDVQKCFLSGVAVGLVSLMDAASGGHTLATIEIGRTASRYFRIQLYPTPSAAVTMSVDGTRAIEDLSLDTDEPLWPEDFHPLLVHAAVAEEWRERDDNRAEREEALAMRILSDLRYTIEQDDDRIDVQRGPRMGPSRMSRLGANYPPGT